MKGFVALEQPPYPVVILLKSIEAVCALRRIIYIRASAARELALILKIIKISLLIFIL